jgi:iron complex transport system ATP-binding protein
LASHGIGILLITHHLGDITPEIERVVMLREGRIFGDGPKSKLLTEERLQELFGVAVRLIQQDGHYHVC